MYKLLYFFTKRLLEREIISYWRKMWDRMAWRERLMKKRRGHGENQPLQWSSDGSSNWRVFKANMTCYILVRALSHIFQKSRWFHVSTVPYRITQHKHFTNQQTVGGVDGEAAGEGVVYGEPVHVGGLPVASSLVNISAHVEMEWVAAFLALLSHVLQLHVGKMHWWKVTKDLPV